MNPGDAAIVRLYDTIRMEMINHYIISANPSAAHFGCMFQRFDGSFLECCQFGNDAVIPRRVWVLKLANKNVKDSS